MAVQASYPSHGNAVLSSNDSVDALDSLYRRLAESHLSDWQQVELFKSALSDRAILRHPELARLLEFAYEIGWKAALTTSEVRTAVSTAFQTVPIYDLRRLGIWQKVFGTQFDWVAVSAAQRAARLAGNVGQPAQETVVWLRELVERQFAGGRSEFDALPAAVSAIWELLPVVSEQLLYWLLERRNSQFMEFRPNPYQDITARSRFLHYLRVAPLTVDQQRAVMAYADPYLDRALTANESIDYDCAVDLAARYADRSPHVQRLFVAATPGRAEELLAARDYNLLRGLAAKLNQVEPPQRAAVARAALDEICADPDDDDADAVTLIVEQLGTSAALRILHLEYDLLARSVRRAWKWTADEVFDALASYPRLIVRRKLVPGGAQWGEPYQFSAAQEHDLRTTIVPRLLRDRSSQVQQRARNLQNFFDWRDLTGLSESDYQYPEQTAYFSGVPLVPRDAWSRPNKVDSTTARPADSDWNGWDRVWWALTPEPLDPRRSWAKVVRISPDLVALDDAVGHAAGPQQLEISKKELLDRISQARWAVAPDGRVGPFGEKVILRRIVAELAARRSESSIKLDYSVCDNTDGSAIGPACPGRRAVVFMRVTRFKDSRKAGKLLRLCGPCGERLTFWGLTRFFRVEARRLPRRDDQYS